MLYTALIGIPSHDSINTGLSPMNTDKLRHQFGDPCAHMTADCQPVTSPHLATRMMTQRITPTFRATGMDYAISDLLTILQQVEIKDPALYALVGSAGMLCARFVRGSNSVISNHSYGLAIDLTIGGILTPRGSSTITYGLLALYPYFHAAGWYWGAEFPTTDAMHFEQSWERYQQHETQRISGGG